MRAVLLQFHAAPAQGGREPYSVCTVCLRENMSLVLRGHPLPSYHLDILLTHMHVYTYIYIYICCCDGVLEAATKDSFLRRVQHNKSLLYHHTACTAALYNFQEEVGL